MQFCIGVSITTKFDKHTCELFIITCAQFLYHTHENLLCSILVKLCTSTFILICR